jgi:hypothetical protein
MEPGRLKINSIDFALSLPPPLTSTLPLEGEGGVRVISDQGNKNSKNKCRDHISDSDSNQIEDTDSNSDDEQAPRGGHRGEDLGILKERQF